MEKIIKTEEEWKTLLSPQAYQVLRKHGTERAFSGEYNDNHSEGKYYCAGCGHLLFDSKAKFDSSILGLCSFLTKSITQSPKAVPINPKTPINAQLA